MTAEALTRCPEHLRDSTAGRVLAELSSGTPCSGTALGAALGISRAAVGKAVGVLRELGAPVQAISGQGYLLPGGYEPLRPEVIDDWLRRYGVSPVPYGIRFRTASTSVDLRAPSDDAPSPATVALAAECQSAGRGRVGRSWSSPLGGVYVSVRTGLPTLTSPTVSFGLAAAVELAEIMERLGSPPGLKWPNDLLQDQRKVGGVLSEHAGELLGPCRMTVGVGINLREAPAVPGREAFPAGGLRPPPVQRPRNALVAGVIAAVVRAQEVFAVEGFGAYRERWARYDALLGRRVTVVRPAPEAGLRPSDEAARGIVSGVDEFGRVLLEPAPGASLVPVASGEVQAAGESL